MGNLVRALALILLACSMTSVADADTLDDVRQRGALRWGGDISGGGPYVYQNPDGSLTGFEYELMDYVARELGVKSEYVNWEWEMLPQKLKQGGMEMVLNGYEWSEEHERETPSTIPYYIYRLQLLARKDDASINSWDDLRVKAGERKKRVGALQGATSARFLEKEFGGAIELKLYAELTMLMGLVEQGQLDATLQDLPTVIYYARDYPKLRAVGEPVEPGYYVGYVRPGDDTLREGINAAFLKAFEDGTMRRIYEKYGVWNDEQLQLAEKAKNWPPPVAPPPSRRWENLPDYAWKLLQAAGMTVLLSFLSMPLAMLIGLLVAIGRLYGPALIRVPLGVYVEFLRGTPLLMQLFVLYYIVPQYTGLSLPEFWTGVLGLAINYSAYEAENYRAGLLAIPRGQMEAALSLGMSTRTALRRIIVPQAVRIVIPPVTNDFIALFKDTSVVSMISVTELTLEYRNLMNSHPRLMLEFGLMTAILYMAMSYPLSLIASRLESRFKKVNG